MRGLVEVSKWNLNSDFEMTEETNLVVPIISEGDHLATAVIHEATDMKLEDRNVVSDLVRLVLTPTLEKFRPTFATESQEFGFERAPHGSLFLLESGNSALVRRVSLQIHELLGSWAFLKYEDVFEHLSTSEDLKSLGPMTILMPDVLSLSQFEQTLLVEYSQKAERKEDPFLIMTSTMPLKRIQETRSYNQELLLYLAHHRLNLDAVPLSAGLLKQTLELIFDSQTLLN